MQFQVPQFIDVEDKIIGPLTLKQFGYLAAAGGLSFFLFFTVSTWLWFILSAVIVGVGVGFAFIKINGRPLVRIALSAFSFYWKPQTYVWQPEHPQMHKTGSSLQSLAQGFSLEKIVAGLSLRNVWQSVQTGSKAAIEKPHREFKRIKEHYEIVHKISGERRAARRVDYR
jgi:hypothetical protein